MIDEDSNKNEEVAPSEDVLSKAEARRKRILEASQKRMDIVSGNATNDTKDEGGQDDVQKSSGSSRLSQMRRRRFKSNKKLSTSNDESTAPESSEAKKSSVEQSETESPPVVEEKKDPPTTETESETTGEENPKKYMGVAKMRRKRLAERKASTDPKNPKGSDLAVDLKSGHSKFAVLMQLSTIMLLFLSGWDVGQSSVANRVESQLHVPSWLGGKESVVNQNIVDSIAADSIQVQRNNIYLQESMEEDFVYAKDEDLDEFGDHPKKPSGATLPRKSDPNNIDPLFGIDMDALTDGREGLYWSIARFAIFMHRVNLYFFYELPKYFFWEIPKRWISTPPILFLLAVIIRAVGKHVLNAHVPELEDILVKKYENTTDNKKILEVGEEKSAADTAAALDPEKMTSVATNFVKNWIQKQVPTAFMIFTILRDVRQDMYIVLCGLVLGMVASSGSDENSIFLPSWLLTTKIGTAGDGEL